MTEGSTQSKGRREVCMAVTLINVFSVPVGKEDEFVAWWHDAA